MSVTSARAFLAVCGGVFIGCVGWLCIGLQRLNFNYRQLSSDMVAPAAIGLISGAFLLVALFMFSRFMEATIERRNGARANARAGTTLVVRRVLRPPKSIDLADIEQIVLIPNLVLPSRTGPSSVLRVVVRMRSGSVFAFTPRNANIRNMFTDAGIEAEVDDDVLTPDSASHRYPGSAGLGERAAALLGPAAILVGVAVLVWVIWEASHL